MSQRVKKYLALMNFIKKMPKTMKNKIKYLLYDDEFTNCICEVCHNLIKSVIPLKQCHKRKLSRYKRLIRHLGDKNSKNPKIKRRVLLQKGGAFLPLLFSIITPLLTRFIKNNNA